MFFREGLHRLVAAAKYLRLRGSAIYGAALLNLDGYEFATQGKSGDVTVPADRNDIIFPEIRIEQIDEVTDVDALARPMLDILWQAFGKLHCTDYDSNGVWLRQPVPRVYFWGE